MFFSCKKLTSAPVLPATTLAEGCYKTMFYFCEKLSNVTCLATDISADKCVENWLKEVSATGTFKKAAGAVWPEGESGIPSGWTVTEQ